MPPRVLLIDDNRDNLRVAVAHLEAAGIETRTARDGLTGIERARAARADLILLDIQMPGLDGYATCRRLKADAELADIPVIFMTARTTVEDKVRGFDAGGVDYVTKPFEAPELLARVRTHLELRGLRQELADQNATLERRVAEQVADLKRLNAQLRAQIEDRSEALGRALDRLAAASPHEDLVRPGMVLDGRYAIEARIAGGGMGMVFRGLDQHTGEPVALKIIRPSAGAPMPLLRRFLKEARVAAQIEHPAVVRMLHVDIHEDGMLYQVQEFVDGRTLESLLKLGLDMAPYAARILATLAEALSAAHARGVVHRDVKPGNILLTADAPGLKLVDFGISKRSDAFADTLLSESPDTTKVGVILGTPEYMSPEQLRGTLDVGTPTDVYAFGVVAHRLYTGTYPGRTPIEELTAATIIQGCLDPVPLNRPSMAELREVFVDGARELPSLESLVRNELRLATSSDDRPTSFPADA